MGQVRQSNAPTYGVLIRCTLEGGDREGQSIWIDLEELDDEEHADVLVGQLTGKADDPYPDSWNDEGTFEVEEVRGLGPRLAALASDDEMPGLVMETWADLAAAIQELEPGEIAPFLAWADGEDSWLPGYGAHPPSDAVLWFRCSPAAAGSAPALGTPSRHPLGDSITSVPRKPRTKGARQNFLSAARALPATVRRPAGLQPLTPLEALQTTLSLSDQAAASQLLLHGPQEFRQAFRPTPAALGLGILEVVVWGSGGTAWVELVPAKAVQRPEQLSGF